MRLAVVGGGWTIQGNKASNTGTVDVLGATNVTLNDTNGLTLGNVTASGTLDATAAGSLNLPKRQCRRVPCHHSLGSLARVGSRNS